MEQNPRYPKSKQPLANGSTDTTSGKSTHDSSKQCPTFSQTKYNRQTSRHTYSRTSPNRRRFTHPTHPQHRLDLVRATESLHHRSSSVLGHSSKRGIPRRNSSRQSRESAHEIGSPCRFWTSAFSDPVKSNKNGQAFTSSPHECDSGSAYRTRKE